MSNAEGKAENISRCEGDRLWPHPDVGRKVIQ
jgi:hypothetical protein